MTRLGEQAQAAAEVVWSTLADRDPPGRTGEEASPWSYPMGE